MLSVNLLDFLDCFTKCSVDAKENKLMLQREGEGEVSAHSHTVLYLRFLLLNVNEH